MKLIARSIDLGSTRLAYQFKDRETPGDADPVILLHPWRGSWQFWVPTLRSLPEYECFAVDLYSPGQHGGMEFASPEGLAKAIRALLGAHAVRRCSLVGNSMGGIVSQILAADLGDRIHRLVLVGSGARIGRPDLQDELGRWLRSPVDRASTRYYVGQLLARHPESTPDFDTYVDEVMNANREFMRTAMHAAFSLDMRPRLREITARTLVSRGELDTVITREHVGELLAGIPDSEALEFVGAGHAPQVDSPHEFATALSQFLETGHVDEAVQSTPGSQ